MKCPICAEVITHAGDHTVADHTVVDFEEDTGQVTVEADIPIAVDDMLRALTEGTYTLVGDTD